MNTAKVYHDATGNECSIHQMVREEPAWSASRIQQGEEAEEELKELKQRFNKMLCVSLSSADFETNTIEIKLPKEVMAKGFHCGMVLVELNDVQKES